MSKIRIRRATIDDLDDISPLVYVGLASLLPEIAVAKIILAPKFQICFGIITYFIASYYDNYFTVGAICLVVINCGLYFLGKIAGHLFLKGECPDMFVPEKFLDWFVQDDNIQFWVAEDISCYEKPKIVGTVGLKPPDVIQKAYMKKMAMKNGVELKRMSVAKTHRRLGISKMLMDTVFKNAKLLVHDDDQPMNIFLSTSEFQTPAIKLYEKYGFTCFTKHYFQVFPGVEVEGQFFHKAMDSC